MPPGVEKRRWVAKLLADETRSWLELIVDRRVRPLCLLPIGWLEASQLSHQLMSTGFEITWFSWDGEMSLFLSLSDVMAVCSIFFMHRCSAFIFHKSISNINININIYIYINYIWELTLDKNANNANFGLLSPYYRHGCRDHYYNPDTLMQRPWEQCVTMGGCVMGL